MKRLRVFSEKLGGQMVVSFADGPQLCPVGASIPYYSYWANSTGSRWSNGGNAKWTNSTGSRWSNGGNYKWTNSTGSRWSNGGSYKWTNSTGSRWSNQTSWSNNSGK